MQKQRILIIGGGMASLSAAWALTELPQATERFEIEIHEATWRLGGKCANHRGVHGRIEEHGLHVLLGSYHNTFAMLRTVYHELARPPDHPLATFDKAFVGNDLMRLYETVDGELIPWTVTFPALPGLPGDANSMLPRASDVLRLLVGGAVDLQKRIWSARARCGGVFDELRRARIMAELARVMARGLVVDNVMLRGIDSLDDTDFRLWLRRHGASDEALNSAPVRSLYQLVFAELDLSKPASGLSAATGLRMALRWCLGYRGHVGWWMQGGTAEVLVMPLYQALLGRGVRFRFMSTCSDIVPDSSGKSVVSVVMRSDDRGKSGFSPTDVVGGVDVWRANPPARKRGQSTRKRTLRVGRDFDAVILGAPVATLPDTCPSLLKASARWREMLQAIDTTRTIGVQVWSDVPRAGPQEMANSGVEPLTGYSDMSHLLDRELWPKEDAPRHVLHVCHRLPDDPKIDDGDQEGWQNRGDEIARRWIAGVGGHHVPGARSGLLGDRTDWQVLHDPAGGVGEDRLNAQYKIVTTNPSDRYTLATPGTLSSRIRPDESGFDGLMVCGTWTRNGLNAGAVEAAVMSGRLAARGLAGGNVTVVGESDWG